MHIVHTEASLGWGGQEIRILTESAGLLERGEKVTLLCPPDSKIYAEALLRGIPVVPLPIGHKNPQGIYGLFNWLKNNPATVVNTHSSTDSWLAALALQLLKKALPIVRTRHISAPVPNNMATRWLYTRASRHIVTTGEALRQQLMNTNGYPGERITSVPTGIDTDYFVPGDRMGARARLGLNTSNYIVGIVATLRSWKGHRYLVEAFAEIADKNTRLLIVGDGPQRVALEKQIAERGLADRVWMVGNQSDVLPWLQALDIFVLPSYANEGVPQALIQAMLCGLPVITTPIGGILEAVQHEQTGLIVEPHRPASLRNAITRLMHDDSLGKTLGTAARACAQEKFSLAAMLDNMQRIFAGVCRQR